MDAAPLILTLKLDPESFARFDTLRRAHFPPERNFLSAHVTLFHHLPGPQLAAIRNEIKAVCRDTAPFAIDVAGVKSLGRGVAFQLRSRDLDELRHRLASLWSDWLLPQDRQGFRAHVTVQNKVDPRQAKDLLAELSSGFTPWRAEGRGLQLWHYRDGPWEAAGETVFSGR